MHTLAIDVGSYSVKYVSSFVDKRKVSLREMSEVIIRDYLSDRPDLTQQEAQNAIVQEIIDSIARPDTKVVFQANNEFMTTRFLTLPVKSKKKAELMLPFQLEEDIPYALSEIHYAYRMEAQKSQHQAMVELVQESTFETYLEDLREKDCVPNLLTTEASVMENFFGKNSLAGPFCVLDLGHRTTKGYFFQNSKLLLTNVSYVAGAEIDEMIAQNYTIERDEAIIYKHQNAFVLTSNQFDSVEPAQQEFALAMDKLLAPLVTEVTRWKVGFKVNFGLSIGHIFICGGTANLKNIANYLTEKLDVKVALLESFDKVEVGKIDLNPKNKSKFALANMMTQGMRQRNKFINLLIGKFTQASSSELPLHSIAFFGVRVALITVILAVSLVAERIFIMTDIEYVNKSMTTLLKNSQLGVPKRVQTTALKNPQPAYAALLKRQKAVHQEIRTIESAVRIQALSPLLNLSQIAASARETILTEFYSDDASGEVRATFTSESKEELASLKTTLEQSSLDDVVVEIDPSGQTLKLTASMGN